MQEIASVGAGQIVAVMGLKDTTTGETLCDQPDPVVLESMDFPAPVIEQAIEPKTKSDQEKLGMAIQRLAEEDPTFRVHTDDETGQTIIAGMGELHLEMLIDRMKREFGSRPTSASRRSPIARRSAGRSRRSTTPTRSRPAVRVSTRKVDHQPGAAAEPAAPATSSSTPITGGRIPKEYIPAVDEGVQDAMQFGVLAGYPIDDVKVTLRRRRLPRRRLLRARVQDRRLDGLQGGRPQGRSGACSSR